MKNSKQRLFEVTSRLDKTFKLKLNENTDVVDAIKRLESNDVAYIWN
jgi:hypothetical protein